MRKNIEIIPVTLVWLRRDLRLEDNAALYQALKSSRSVLPVFIFDTEILDLLDDKKDKRVQFIHQVIVRLHKILKEKGSTLLVKYGKPIEIWKKLDEEFSIAAVYFNNDYEPYARARDHAVIEFLFSKKIPVHTFKDQVIFEKDEIIKDDGSPYTIWTPYSKRWKERYHDSSLQNFPAEQYEANFHKTSEAAIPSLADIGFMETNSLFPPEFATDEFISHYHETRNFPGTEGTSKLSVHLRFGTISIRQLAKRAKNLNEKYLNELIWRDFYQMILWHFPFVVHRAFKKEFEFIEWRNEEREFERWCEGKTGFPIVDAGMRELNATGFMHNRVRMITASFLTKDLLIDWRWGEAYFAKKLLDYDLASNNGGWQWAAGTGADAAPYFRIFNPSIQLKKFDPELKYIKKWVPEFEQLTYPLPIVDHQFARDRALKIYKAALVGN